MWPFTEAYPERRLADVGGRKFDYVIVGGGTAACVLASRLTEDPDVSVLLLCRGGVDDSWWRRIPLLGQMEDGEGYHSTVYLSEPVESSGGKQARIHTSTLLGGATRVNGLMVTRGCPGDYNDWARMGQTLWGWKQVEPFFKKSENAVGHPRAEHRGHDGPLPTRHIPTMSGIDPYITKAAIEVGLPVQEDANNPRGPAMGLFDIEILVSEAVSRCSTFHGFLPKHLALQRKNKLSICTGALATRLELDSSRGEVKGVHVVDIMAKGTNKESFVAAEREVIVCCGALGSPQVLLLSGLGPAQQLKKHKIPVVRDTPGVGENLSDHVMFGLDFEVQIGHSLMRLLFPLVFLWQALLFVLFRTGPLAATAVNRCIWVRSGAIDDDTMTIRRQGGKVNDMDPSLPQNIPDIEFMLSPSSTKREPTKTGYYSLLATLAQTYSRGRVELASTDPLTPLRIFHPLLTDPRDMILARKAARFAMNFVEKFRAAGYPFRAVWNNAPGMETGTVGGSWKDVTNAQIDDYAREFATSAYHPTSTCRMAPEEEGGVVGQDLRVHGWKNLRIADASVFPKLTSAHTMAPVIMIAERCAAMIAHENRKKEE